MLDVDLRTSQFQQSLRPRCRIDGERQEPAKVIGHLRVSQRLYPVQAQFDSKKVAQSPASYQAVQHAITGLYKDELLKSAGITV